MQESLAALQPWPGNKLSMVHLTETTVALTVSHPHQHHDFLCSSLSSMPAAVFDPADSCFLQATIKIHHLLRNPMPSCLLCSPLYGPPMPQGILTEPLLTLTALLQPKVFPPLCKLLLQLLNAYSLPAI